MHAKWNAIKNGRQKTHKKRERRDFEWWLRYLPLFFANLHGCRFSSSFLFPPPPLPFPLSTSLFSFRPPLSQPILIVLLMIASPPRPPIPSFTTLFSSCAPYLHLIEVYLRVWMFWYYVYCSSSSSFCPTVGFFVGVVSFCLSANCAC